jgi:hypothetical protein
MRIGSTLESIALENSHNALHAYDIQLFQIEQVTKHS